MTLPESKPRSTRGRLGREGAVAEPHLIRAFTLVLRPYSAALQAGLWHRGRDRDWEQHPADLPVEGGLSSPSVQLEELQRPEPGAAGPSR